MTIRHFDNFDMYKAPNFKPKPGEKPYFGFDLASGPDKAVKVWYRDGKIVKVEEL